MVDKYKKGYEIMKKDKLRKVFLYTVVSLVIASLIFLLFSYFVKEEDAKKTDRSEKDNKQERIERKRENEENKTKEQDKEEQNQKVSTSEKKAQSIEADARNKETVSNNAKSSAVAEVYKGKKVSESEGVGTTGKVFKSQKEALDFGKKEIKRLTEEDKKGRQFSISKVAAEDGSLIGWTVDIFEDNNIEKIVSNPVKETEDKQDKE
ncbi:sarcalumenin [uncultured Gemella sp.]|uniref:sarcalumenin n=1 Tax=uncultured Gemella sp. TaxID=254352 RepID=UPI0028D6F8BE|nr:sarcalumenin [uncultured Gemella sp.]